jgi:hypothetical protein
MPPLQAVVPFAGTGHGVQDVPHDAGEVLSAQTAPQAWKPALQVKPHDVPSQVSTPFGGGGGQGVHDVPHEPTDVLLAQAAPHAW